ncbi:chain length determinant protein EpsF [Paucibacter sp. DJ1R-11]|uniref:chain length determinant protein EpsF n=1 Tax=Paucibacter sp. DJ1R-11 TaxID=2893556 RepID=UPI0021E489E1|nr:chain length determinant protein EpsF [Paucibacter sp. DJ1R-11]MCV2365060.1 chain length determinant protein EpsF [Paucibacter sp. DJ1R-11]
MTFGQFIAILQARWKLAVLVLIATVAVVMAITVVLPKQYTATASFVVDAKPDPYSAITYGAMITPAFMTTQVDIIQSDRVAQRVVRSLKLTENPQVREKWQEATEGKGSVEVWLAESFQKNLDVRPSRESNVVTVSYKAEDPKFAAGLANAFVQAYLDTVLELKVDPAKQYSSFFDSRAKDARGTLEAAQVKLSAFQREKGIINADERLDVENARLNELSSQLVGLQAITSESGSRNAQATGSSGERMQEVLNNPIVGTLKADLSRAEVRLQEVNARLGDSHPQVVELKANIAELRIKISEETRRITGGVGVTNTINRQRETQLRAELEAQRAKVLQMKQVRDEGAVLSRDVENAQRAYDSVQARLTQSSLDSQSTQSNVSALTVASPPLEPSSPRSFLNALIAVFGGTLLGVLAAFFKEVSDRRIRTVEDISASLGIAVIGVMPKPGSAKSGQLATAAAQRRVIGHSA